VELVEPGLVGDEATLLGQFLDYYRATMVRKVEGLTKAQLAQRLEPSTLTLGGLVKHLALVEDSWFQERLLGREPVEPWAAVDWDATPDWDFDSAADDEPAEIVALYEAACERSRRAVREAESLDVVMVVPNRRGERMSLRWILIHMIEETARHAGHADLIRESIDGRTGD
jgi:uncharacterized damage-inducible protein DinB